MKTKTRRIIWISAALLALSSASVGYYLYNKGPLDVKNSRGSKVHAAGLYEAFITDSVTAQKKYTGKVLVVDGIAASVTHNRDNNLVVSIKTNTEGAYINCTMEENVENIPEGEPVVVKGICSGIGQGEPELGIQGDVYLIRCFMEK